MSDRTRDPRLSGLPDELPIFPLAGVLLLPRGHLPLNVFEPRYLNMTEHALGHGRTIGMVQPRHGESETVGDSAAVYDVGCAGRIVSFAETADGRFLVTLRGVCRFRIVTELELRRGFRLVTPDFQPFQSDLEEEAPPPVDRNRLLGAVRAYFAMKSIDADWSAIEDAAADALVTSLAMICPFEPREKQALLEVPGSSERAELLVSLMEMAVHAADRMTDNARH